MLFFFRSDNGSGDKSQVMHFWIDKRSQTCGFSGRHRVPSSLGTASKYFTVLHISFYVSLSYARTPLAFIQIERNNSLKKRLYSRNYMGAHRVRMSKGERRQRPPRPRCQVTDGGRCKVVEFGISSLFNAVFDDEHNKTLL